MQKLQTIFISLLLCLLVSPAHAIKIYNMAPLLKLPADHGLTESTFINQSKTYYMGHIWNEAHMNKTLRKLPSRRFTMFNVESFDGATEVFDYDKNPEAAIKLREKMVDYVRLKRPDIPFCMYFLPGDMGAAYNGDASDEKAWTEREEAMTVITDNMTHLCIRGSWRFNDYEAAGWQEKSWRTRMLNKVAMTQLVHGKKPVVVLSNRIVNDKTRKLVPLDILLYQLDFCQQYGLDVVFWAWRDDDKFVKHTDLALNFYSTMP